MVYPTQERVVELQQIKFRQTMKTVFIESPCCSKCQISKTFLFWSQVAVSYSRNITFTESFPACEEWRCIFQGVFTHMYFNEEKQCPLINLKLSKFWSMREYRG